MYRRSKFLEILHEIRQGMALEADYEIDSFAEIARRGEGQKDGEEGSPEDDSILETLILEDVAKGKNQRPKSKK
jgi:hypothetical protein